MPCETQAEIDRLWDALTADGGKEVQCGWLEDRFGLSWQIVPSRLGEWLGHPDPEAAQRATQAMLSMQKLDIAALEAAVAGDSRSSARQGVDGSGQHQQDDAWPSAATSRRDGQRGAARRERCRSRAVPTVHMGQPQAALLLPFLGRDLPGTRGLGEGHDLGGDDR